MYYFFVKVMINSAIIPAAGLGTRLLTYAKESPKEMVPLFYSFKNKMVLLPLIERIFLQLYDAGIRNFCFIVGKKKRLVEDHFTPDNDYLRILNSQKDRPFRLMIKDLHKKIENSKIMWINQNTPKGFGAAVLMAKESMGNKPFLVHTGDAFIRGNHQHISKLIQSYDEQNPDFMIYLTEINNPKEYGVAEATLLKKGILQVNKVEEKPKQPKSNFALMPLYAFNSKLFSALEKTRPGLRNEIQLTDGIQHLIENNGNVQAIKFRNPNDCIDIGTPTNYFRALKISYADSLESLD